MRLLFILVFWCVICVKLSAADVAAEKSLSIPRRHFASNSPEIVYQEMRDPDLTNALLRAAGEYDGHRAISVIVGGNEDGFTVSIHALGMDSVPESVINVVLQFVRLRWMGLSRDAALKLSGAVVYKGGQSKQEAALQKACPVLPFNVLRPLQAENCVEFSGLKEGYLYFFEDKDVSLLVAFNSYESNLEASICVVDSKEFQRKTSNAIKAAAKAAHLKVAEKYEEKYRQRLTLYWDELKKTLADQGITWKSPEELNPERSWNE